MKGPVFRAVSPQFRSGIAAVLPDRYGSDTAKRGIRVLLDRNRAQLGVIDVQERLMPAIHEGTRVVENAIRLITAARRLSIPVWASEQYPKGLGHSVPEIAEVVADNELFTKTAFSCARDADLSAHVESLRRRQIVLCGVESHVCVLQSALGYREQGYDVFVVIDAVSSRAPSSMDAAAARLRETGVELVTVEMVLFEWIADATDPAFRDLRGLIV